MQWESLDNSQLSEYSDRTIAKAKSYRSKIMKNTPTIGSGISKCSESIGEQIKKKLDRIVEYNVKVLPKIINWARHNVITPSLGELYKFQYLSKEDSISFITENRGDYIFLPLQYFRESRVTARSPAFYNQAYLIEYISRSLPTGYELVVKDHPEQVGRLPYGSVQTIRRYSTTLAPDVSAHDVIENAAAIITINNTVGYEAIVHGKPVVTLGDAFYNGYGYTIDVKNINNIRKDIHNAVTNWELTDEDVLEFLCGIFEGSQTGQWEVRKSQNIQNISDSIIRFVYN
jgi:hypothetical protein